MKKIIRLLGVTLLFASCTKEIEILEPNLIGQYKYTSVIVSVPLDLNKDGQFEYDLIKENPCGWDNNWQIQESKVILREGKKECGETGADENGVIGSFDYTYNKNQKTITIFYEGGSTEVLKDVKIGYTSDEKQSWSYVLWSEKYQQDITFYLESI
jgi:hypothetical protein